jgi:ABC-2 type transport system permease protein
VIIVTQTNFESKNVVPSSISQVGIITKYTLLDYVRSRRFFIILIITALISVLLTVLVGYYRPAGFLASELGFYSSWWGTSVTFVIILSGIFFGGDAISGEFQNKTGYFGVPNPIRRSSIYIGKWIAAFIASIAILGVFTVVTLGNGLYYFSGVPLQFVESLLFALLYLVAVLGFTFFFSSLFKSSSMSILLTAILFLFVFTLIQQLVAGLVQIEPWFILTYGSQIIGNVLTSPYPPNISTTSLRPGGAGPTLTTYNATIPEGLAIMAIYFAVTAILGLILFERKEFN